MAPTPSAVKIGPLTYTIQHNHDAVVDYSKKAGEDVYGCCQNRILNIVVDTGYPIQRERSTLLHEIIHAIHCTYDLEEQNLKDNVEHYTAVFSKALLSVLQDNPMLVSYLVGDKEEARQPAYCLEVTGGNGRA